MSTKNQEKLSQVLIEFYEKMSSWEHAVVKESGLSLPQMHTIEIIGHHKDLKMNELARKISVTTGTLTVMVDRLERNGLVVRHAHDTDRRSYVITLTEKGQRYFKEHRKLHLELTRKITSSLSDEDSCRLNTLIERVIEHF